VLDEEEIKRIYRSTSGDRLEHAWRLSLAGCGGVSWLSGIHAEDLREIQPEIAAGRREHD
jgi:hypothetical protein